MDLSLRNRGRLNRISGLTVTGTTFQTYVSSPPLCTVLDGSLPEGSRKTQRISGLTVTGINSPTYVSSPPLCTVLDGSLPEESRKTQPHLRSDSNRHHLPNLRFLTTALYGCPTFAPAYVGRIRWAKPYNRFMPAAESTRKVHFRHPDGTIHSGSL